MSQKKKYVKPDLEFVNFVMSSSIAGTCKYEAEHADGNSCTFVDNEWIFFSSGNNDCDGQVGEGNFCYHVPTDNQNIFSS